MPPDQGCTHEILQLDPSPFARLAGFDWQDARARTAAKYKDRVCPPRSGRTPHNQRSERIGQTYPGPLVLPHDDLNYDPDEQPQNMKSWFEEKARNRFGAEGRKTLYVADVPSITQAVENIGMNVWVKPGVENKGNELRSPKVEEVIEYLTAFYHGIAVKEFPKNLAWTTWKSTARTNPKTKGVPKYIALQHDQVVTRIRARPAPDGLFPAQLNLDDILDAAIAMLPQDAYALLLLVDHDIYENEEDDFCCGRAYGGSRVAVVQSARYNPLLDPSNGIDHAHTWPTSHCKNYVDQLCAAEDVVAKPPSLKQCKLSKSGPLRAAISAVSTLEPPTSTTELEGLWFSRVARTASHELGHCLGMAHCVYYACNMQSTAGMEEDARQPPYLCPICLRKLGYAVCTELGAGGETQRAEWERERHEVLSEFCGKEGRGSVGMWKGLDAWSLEVLKE
jgi:archaemetzincin